MKTACYAQVLMKKETGKVVQYALKFQQIVEKGYFNRRAATINLICNEIFTGRLLKN